MPLPARLFADDEELGKKNDDHVPGHADVTLEGTLQWARTSVTAPMKRRRLALIGLIIVGLVFLLKGLPHKAPPPPPKPAPPEHAAAPTAAPTGAPPKPQLRSPNELHYYDGPSKYYSLSKTLQKASRSQGLRPRNKNVLFAAANLQSLDRLLPMACEMARWNRNLVHMAVMGRHDMSIEEIIELNNVDSDCDILWHDARPDYAKYSTDARLSQSVFLTLEHMRHWVHPQAYIVENEDAEEAPFLKSVNRHAHRYQTSVIQLPQNAMQTMQWLARLDTGSLAAWSSTNIEMLVRAPSGASGSLLRLLKSIQKADYFGARYPHLTLELPAKLDRATEDFIDSFVWPPADAEGVPRTSQLTLQRRLLRERVDPVESAMRYIEGYWPSRARDGHVLLLSPDIQLSPMYYHFLLYNLLEYKHSTYAVGTRDSESLAGISLVNPTTLLDGRTPFKVPESAPDEEKDEDYADTTFFQLQSPDTHACLYFGDKWKELHSFFSLRLDSPAPADPKLASRAEPAYASYFQELMLARGYFVLHPGKLETVLATSHTDLFRLPDEWIDPDPEQNDVDDEPLDSDGALLSHPPAPPPRPHLEPPLAWTPLHALLPSSGDLPELSSVPALSHTGQRLTLAATERNARSYTSFFQTAVGGCGEQDTPKRRKGLVADDLFCEHYSRVPKGRGYSTVRVDDYGDPLPEPISEAQKKAMEAEFVKHLQRQGQGQKGAQEQAQAVVADVVEDIAKKVDEAAVKEASKEASKEAGKEAGKEESKEASKEEVKVASKEESKEASKDTAAVDKAAEKEADIAPIDKAAAGILDKFDKADGGAAKGADSPGKVL